MLTYIISAHRTMSLWRRKRKSTLESWSPQICVRLSCSVMEYLDQCIRYFSLWLFCILCHSCTFDCLFSKSWGCLYTLRTSQGIWIPEGDSVKLPVAIKTIHDRTGRQTFSRLTDVRNHDLNMTSAHMSHSIKAMNDSQVFTMNAV